MKFDSTILIPNGFVELPESKNDPAPQAEVATVLSNLAHYGYTVDRDGFDVLNSLDSASLAKWWTALKPELAKMTGEDRKMDRHVVYKNFPRECLEMDAANWVIRQMYVYFGIPYGLVAETEGTRAPLGDVKRLKVLRPADEQTYDRIYDNLQKMPNRWSDNQKVWAEKLVEQRNLIDLDDFSFKENGVALIAQHFEDREVNVSTATDVLRVVAALSSADVSLREKVKMRRFKRAERRKLLQMMEGAKNLEEDFATRPEQFKRLLERLRPGDYKVPRVQAAHDALYNKRVQSFASLVDPQNVSVEMLEAVVTRPGEFLRRFHHYYDLFGADAVEHFAEIMPKLTTRQLVGFRAYIGSINDRVNMIYAPKANWGRAKVFPKTKREIAVADFLRLDERLGEILRERMAKLFPEGVALDPKTRQIKLQSNDQKLAEYGRGTSFDIPENITFIRSASYWAQKSRHSTWFDNGWNFFDENWNSMGTCSWSSQHFGGRGSYSYGFWGSQANNRWANTGKAGAVMSGDPSNINDLKGRGCQMIDLYLDRLVEMGVRFGVFNVLCYSGIMFSDAEEVLATLQMGEDAEQGGLYEPSRAQMIFPLVSKTLTNYVCYIDLKERKIVYMDSALPCSTRSADVNGAKLSTLMPAYAEYLASLPSVHDLMRDAPSGDMPVLYGDRDVAITAERGYVFRAENPQNTFKPVSITDMVVA